MGAEEVDGFSSLDKLGKIGVGQDSTFVYFDAFGRQCTQVRKYPEVSYKAFIFLEEVRPGILHSGFDVSNFYFCDRIDHYVVVDPGKQALLIDTGIYDLCGVKVLEEPLKRYDIPWDKTDIVITHYHDDHAGNVRYCIDRGARSVLHGAFPILGESALEKLCQEIGYEREFGKLTKQHNDVVFYLNHLLFGSSPYTADFSGYKTVHTGDSYDIAQYHFEVFESPGHTIDHICLIEPEQKFIFAGDHILETPPAMMQLYADAKILTRFLDSFRILKDYRLEDVYMSHHDPLHGNELINVFFDKIVESYRRPVNKMLSIVETLKQGTVYDCALQYYSYVKGGFSSQPAILQARRLAIAFCYLEYLHDQDIVKRFVDDDGAFIYEYKQLSAC